MHTHCKFLLLLTFLLLPAVATAQVDSDNDGISDDDEINFVGTDPADPDTDNDGLLDGEEATYACDPLDADTDDDGLSDGMELANSTIPAEADTDTDFLPDGLEMGVTTGIPGGTSDGGASAVSYSGTNMLAFAPDSDPATTTDPLVDDTDNDGLTDGLEDTDRDGAQDADETSPLAADSDLDGLDDFLETDGGLLIDTDSDGTIDALDVDSDDDGLEDSSEGSADPDSDGIGNWRDVDSDGDSLGDGHEAFVMGTDPYDGDSDGDGLGDEIEDADADGVLDPNETNPLAADTDGDAIPDGVESLGGAPVDTDLDGTIDARDDDSDGDGLPDATEGTADVDSDGVGNWRDLDSDDDALSDSLESATSTNPYDPDSDADGLGDGVEDADLDGAVDPTETNPRLFDTDSDGFGDGEELSAGSDPLDPASTPATAAQPLISLVADLPGDQGRRVRVQWARSAKDSAGSSEPILSYSLYRRVDALAPQPTSPAGEAVLHSSAQGSWDFVLNLPASTSPEYSTLAETVCDSTAEGQCWSVFFVRAHTASPASFHDSPPDSGYSVDNLAPNVPSGFVADYASGVELQWEASEDADFRYFRVYRGSDPTFEPSAATLVHETTGLAWSDPAGAVGDHYRLSAVDFAGNESDSAAPATVTGAGGLPGALVLHPNHPNPFNPATTIAFELPAAGRADLAIYDVAGRLVRRLVDAEELDAGRHQRHWDGRDLDGRAVRAGVYLYRLEAGGHRAEGKMVLVK